MFHKIIVLLVPVLLAMSSRNPETENHETVNYGNYVSYYLSYGMNKLVNLNDFSLLFRSTLEERRQYRQDLEKTLQAKDSIPKFFFHRSSIDFVLKNGRKTSFDFSSMDQGLLKVDSQLVRFHKLITYQQAKKQIENEWHRFGELSTAEVFFYAYLWTGLSELYSNRIRLKTSEDWIIGMYAMDKHIASGRFRLHPGSKMVLAHPVIRCQDRKVRAIHKRLFFFQEDRYETTVELDMPANEQWTYSISRRDCKVPISKKGIVERSDKNCPKKGRLMFENRPFYNLIEFAQLCCARKNCEKELEKKHEESKVELYRVYKEVSMLRDISESK
ncbi:MAG: hypothetical protein KDD61_08310 [Bdellovibrionales bacterium]|nr:hypothetical protein [Bdellovibrionales bacterium]